MRHNFKIHILLKLSRTLLGPPRYSKSPTHETWSCKLSKMWMCPEKEWRLTRGIRCNWRTERIHNAGDDKGIFFIWGGTVSFWATGPKYRKVHESFSTRLEYSPVLLCHLWWVKNELLPRSHLKRAGRIESSKESFWPRGWTDNILYLQHWQVL